MAETLRSDLLLPLLIVSGVLVVLVVEWIRLRRELKRSLAEAEAREREIQQLGNQLNQARRMEAVGVLAGSIINNLNNLLAVIMGHTRMASHEVAAGSAARDELDRVLKAGHMAIDLVSEISDFYRQADQARKPTNLLPVVRDTVKLLRDIMPSTVTVIADLKPCGPVLATSTGVQQVLMNLCSNALNAMHRGMGTLEISLHEEVVAEPQRAVPQDLEPGSYVRLTVRDDGKGMDKATLDRIFESYFSGNGGGRKMGIGLATVYRILEAHDGMTIARSQMGKGTTFEIYFPMIAWSVSAPAASFATSDDDADETAPRAVPAPSDPGLAAVLPLTQSDAPATATTNLAGKSTVLLVDDEEMVCQVLTRGLQRLGYRVIAHNDSRKAYADFSATPDLFDVVVTDQIMPHMSGVRLTRKIRDQRPDLPVILFTGFRDSFNENQARQAGVTEFILKPSSHRDLAELIDRLVLRRAESRG